MGFWSTLGKIGGAAAAGIAAPMTGGASLMSLPTILGGAGAALSAGSAQSANNRGNQYAGQMDLAQLLMARDLARLGLERNADNDYLDNQIAREQEGRAGRQDAWKALLSAQHTMSPGAKPQLSPYSVAPRQATDMERQGADAMSQEVMARLTGGNPIAAVTRQNVAFNYDPMTTIDPRLLKAGKMETAGNWLGPILSYLGQSDRDGQPQASTPPLNRGPRVVMT